MSATTRPVLLESGDRLDRAEFHRRYCLRTDIHKAELIAGVVYVASPTRYSAHGGPHGAIAIWLGTYVTRTTGARFAVEATVFLGDDTEVQPDGVLFRVPPPDSNAARIREDDYIEGAPQLVAEVAASSASYDLHDKLAVYRRAGVQEYVVWRTLDQAIDWYRLRGGEYVRLAPNTRGVIESESFPGLRLHVAMLLADDLAGVLAELEPAADR